MTLVRGWESRGFVKLEKKLIYQSQRSTFRNYHFYIIHGIASPEIIRRFLLVLYSTKELLRIENTGVVVSTSTVTNSINYYKVPVLQATSIAPGISKQVSIYQRKLAAICSPIIIEW